MRIGWPLLFVFGLALRAASPPPVILVDGWYFKCPTAPRTSISTFGQLEARLNAAGITTEYFRPCSVPAQHGLARATFEELAQALGSMIELTLQETGAAQVDVIAFSMGSLTVRAYLSGKQNDPGVFQPPAEHKIRKVVFLGGPFFGVGNGESPPGSGHCDPVPDPQDDGVCIGSRFLWDLSIWNQGADDLRGIDAVAVAGSGQMTQVGSGFFDGDGVVSLSSSSLPYPPERTRIVKACHVSEVCMPTVSYVDSDSHPAWLVVKSFLGGTGDWKTVGSSPDRDAAQSANGGLLVGVHDASDNPIDATRVALSGMALDPSFEIGLGLFYSAQIAKGDYTLQATAAIPVPGVPFSPLPGTYTVVTMKPGPLISSVVPSAGGVKQPSIPAGSAIEIRGARLATATAAASPPYPDTLGGTQVTVNGQPVPLKSVSPALISTQLPLSPAGFVRLKVITSEGAHGFNLFVDDAGAAAQPRIAQSGVVNAASFVSGAVAPGEFVTITGANLGPARPVTAAGCAKGLGETKVAFNGIEAFLTYSSATQVNALVPYGVSGKADMTVQYNGGTSDLFPLAVAGSAPGIFTRSYGPGQAWALNDDGTFNSPDNKVGRGGWIVFWATGQGLVNPGGQDGEIVAAPKNVNLPVKVAIDGIDASLLYAVLVYTGEIQVAARIPAGARTGDVPLLLTIGSAASRGDVTISVK
ncbi:MAG TPA: IPT/TIG domain-containing protein [Candidatus Acidoferrales bacterium]|nr:IPT/TIG domain-containing protein [Candidatus Acidoferrales bacterium]